MVSKHHGGSLQKVKPAADGIEIRPGGLRTFLEPHAVRVRQLDGMVAFLRWAAFTPEAQRQTEGIIEIRRSVPQIAVQGLKLPAGESVDHTCHLYRNPIYRRVGYLSFLGLSAEEAPRRPGARASCILVRLPAGVAQSVRAALKWRKRDALPISQRRRHFSISGEVSQPASRQSNVAAVQALEDFQDGDLRARARVSGDALGPPGGPGGVAALDWEETACDEGAGPVRAAVSAWRRSNPGQPWRLSRLNARLIERYCRQLDAVTGSEGYGARWLIGQIEDAFQPYCGSGALLGRKPWDRDAPRGGGRPRSLAYFVRLLRGKARKARGKRGRYGV